MFGRNRRVSPYGYVSPIDQVLAVEAEVDVIQDIEQGDFFAAVEDSQAASDYSRGDTFGGMVDQEIADIF